MADSRLEEQLEALENLPFSISRLLTEMRSIDARADALQKEIAALERSVLRNGKARSGSRGAAGGGYEEHYASLHAIEVKRVALRGLLDEKDAITLQAKAATNERVAELDTELASFEADLRSRGDFEIGGGFKIGDEVAARINEAENLWILCRITQFFSLASQYEVSDIEDTTKRYTLPADYIVLIPEEGSDDVMAHRFQKSQEILAMYPDTTSFYKATISTAPKRHSSGGPPPAITVQFADDHDETGTIPHRPVPSRFVLPMPEEF